MEPVGAHAGQNDSQGGGAEHRRRVPEENVHRGPAEIHRRAIVEAEDHGALGAVAREPHMTPARRHIDPPGDERLSIHSFPGLHPDLGREVLCEDGREDRRHMLHDENRDPPKRSADAGEDIADRLRAARRGTDKQAAGQYERPRCRDDAGNSGDGPFSTPPARQDRVLRRLAARPRQRFDLGDELVAEAHRCRDLAIGFGLRQIVDGPELEALQRDLGVALGEGRDHDDAESRALLQQARECADPVKLGHIEVEKHDLRIDTVERLDRGAPVRYGRDDLDPALCQPARNQPTHHDGVVRDKDPRPARRRGRRERGLSQAHRAGMERRHDGAVAWG